MMYAPATFEGPPGSDLGVEARLQADFEDLFYEHQVGGFASMEAVCTAGLRGCGTSAVRSGRERGASEPTSWTSVTTTRWVISCLQLGVHACVCVYVTADVRCRGATAVRSGQEQADLCTVTTTSSRQVLAL